ncbi:MAG TPA: TlpA disulfide reductase family protein [Vicinamibacterales bacterium]|nr:TlpA disulfide reductase family protein [Vicinamibacterales bacterium]
MSNRTALVVGIALLAASVMWLGTRYARQHVSVGDERAAADDGAPTLRFFRNPRPMAEFAARTIDGHDLSSSSLHGKVTIVNFWATWCPPCRAEIPDLVRLQDKYRDRLQIIGISEDEDGAEKVVRFAADHDMNYPIVMTSPELEGKFPGVGALPTSFIIDRDGRIVQKHVGMLRAAVTELETRHLSGLPVDATIEEVDQTQKLELGANAQALTIPGIDLAQLSPAKRTAALEKLNSDGCTCGCDLTLARCRVDDPTCSVSLPLARTIVDRLASQR